MHSLCLTGTFIQIEAQVWFVSLIHQSFILVESVKWLDWVRKLYIDTGMYCYTIPVMASCEEANLDI